MLAIASAACATTTTERLGLDPPRTAERVELSRYLGTWYEIASFPQGFQEGCTATTADYSLRDDGDIRVVNRCRRGSTEGELTEAHGVARVVDDATRAKLEVSFGETIGSWSTVTSTTTRSLATRVVTIFGSWRVNRKWTARATAPSFLG
jgi:lipocalin